MFENKGFLKVNVSCGSRLPIHGLRAEISKVCLMWRLAAIKFILFLSRASRWQFSVMGRLTMWGFTLTTDRFQLSTVHMGNPDAFDFVQRTPGNLFFHPSYDVSLDWQENDRAVWRKLLTMGIFLTHSAKWDPTLKVWFVNTFKGGQL